MSDPPLDVASLRRLEDDVGGREALREIIRVFLGEAPNLVAEIARTAQGGDLGQAARAGHSLKSTAATFGAARLSRLAADVERAAKDEDTARRAAGVIGEEWARVREALEREAAG